MLRNQELLFEEIGNIIAQTLSVECFEEVAKDSQRIFTLIHNNNFWVFLTFMTYHIDNSKDYFFKLK